MLRLFKQSDALSILGLGSGRDAASESARARQDTILARQLDAAIASVPMTVVSNIGILVVIALTAFGEVSLLQIGVWSATTLVVLSLLLLTYIGYTRDKSREVDRTLHWSRRHELMSALRALAWSAGTVAFFPNVDPGRQLVIGLTAAAMMCGGAFALGSLPILAIAFVLITGSGSLLALILAGNEETYALSALTIIFVLFLWAAIMNQARIFISNVRGEISNKEQRRTIGILLKEFEDNSADWLWHTNAAGYFIEASERFAAVSGRDASELQSLRFSDLFSIGTDAINREAVELFGYRSPMTDVEVWVSVEGERRHWVLSARPGYDDNGEFTGYRGVASDTTDLQAASDRLENLAHFDQLTELPNRASFVESLKRQLAAYGPDSVGLVLFDLTGFKLVNDTLGHGVGDQLLARLGKRLAGLGTQHRMLARIGGDEFAMLVSDHPSPTEIRAAANDALNIFATPFAIGPHNLVIDASAGIALGGRDGADAAELLRAADLALYAAKSRGRGLWLEYSSEMASAHLRRQNLERGLRDAISKHELSLKFQPIIAAKSGEVTAFEALLRWNSAEFGVVGPDEFIPIAEECGLIVPIGNWVLHQATRVCTESSRDIEICVNVSPVQLRNKNLVSAVKSALKSSGLAPERLVIEITEGVFLDRSAQTDKTLHDLVALGVQIALDDFGTGYSSLSYLRSFPFAKIKIDKSFIDDIDNGGPNTLITQAIVDLANALGYDTVAEGVETHSQLAEIIKLGCDSVQGYLFSRPLDRDEVDDFMAERDRELSRTA